MPPDILLILDASGSMDESVTDEECNGGCGPESKWALMMPAIDEVLAQTQTTVNWGLKIFGDIAGDECGVSPNTVAVPVAASNAGPISAAIDMRTSANGGLLDGSRTPTRLAMNAGVTYLNGLTDANPKFILLATDGQPNCGAAGGMAADDDASIDAVERAAAAGYRTFVVGIATNGGAADAALNGMAVAGGFPRMGSSPSYYPVTTGAQLATALNTLVEVAVSCTFPVPPPPNSDASRDHISVWVNGAKLPTSSTDGWSYGASGNSSIVISGPLCDQILSGAQTDVKIVFDCILG